MLRLRKNVAGISVGFLLFGSIFGAERATCASIRPSLLAGLMQQPSSQYYHYVYGGQLDLARAEDASFIRGQYLERPVFRHGGFQDQDFSAAVLFGARVLKHKNFGVSAVLGGGYAWGYLKEDEQENPRRQTYRLPGVATGVEGRWSNSWIDIRLSHQLMICQNDNEQLQAHVAWPFTWFLFSVSSPLSWGEP